MEQVNKNNVFHNSGLEVQNVSTSLGKNIFHFITKPTVLCRTSKQHTIMIKASQDRYRLFLK